MLTCRLTGGLWLSSTVSGSTILTSSGSLKEIAAHSVIDNPHKVRHYASLADADVQYPNEDNGWMVAYATQAIPTLDLRRFNAFLNDCNTLKRMLSPPLIAEPRPVVVPAAAVVDDAVYAPNPTVPSPPATPPPPPAALLPTPTVSAPAPVDAVPAPAGLVSGGAPDENPAARGKLGAKSKGARRRANRAIRKAAGTLPATRPNLSPNTRDDSDRSTPSPRSASPPGSRRGISAVWVPYIQPIKGGAA